jgi:hypothetical protein
MVTSAAQAAPLPAPDPAIAAALAKVSADRPKSDDSRLVAFGTRNTFTEKMGDQRGVFAARAWIAAQFREIAKASKGRMPVAYDSHIHQADGKRVVRDVEISNVIATLEGDEPGGRTYVMSSLYDSRNSENADTTHDAPGADDNASGTVAVLEAARVMAALPLHATVIFATYDSEEQGLLGSAHHAAALKAAGVDVQGDLNNDIIGASVGDQGEKNPGTVRRKTTDAFWLDLSQHMIQFGVTDVGNVTAATLPYSKDNWLFAVRAVDAQGHRGVPVFPVPVR